MSKIIFMTNVIRRFGIMQQMLDKLQNNGEMQGDFSCWWVTDNTEWNAEAENRLSGTDFLLLKWMGSGLTTTFLKRVHAYAQQKNISYYIDAAGGDDDNLIQGITPEQEDAIRLYSVYGGESNLYQSIGRESFTHGQKRYIRIWQSMKKISAARGGLQ